MTQAEFAQWLDVKTRTVIAWENDQNPMPDWAVKKCREDGPKLNPPLSLDQFLKAAEKAAEKKMTLDEWIADLIKKSLLLAFFIGAAWMALS